MYRGTGCGGRFFHHRPDDDPSRLDHDLMARLLDAVAALVADLASRDQVPFARAVPEKQAQKVEDFWVDLFGGWTG